MRTNCYFAAFDQNSDVAIRFSNSDVLKESNNRTIGRRFDAVTVTDTYLERVNLFHVIQLLPNWIQIEQSAAKLLMI